MSEASDEFCPYVGLPSFDDSHADYFFGRDLDSGNIADHIISRSIIVVYGNSGTGKSSVLNVGLPRALAELGIEQRPQILRQWYPVSLSMEWLSQVSANAGKHLFLVFDQFEEFFLYREQDEIETFTKELRRLLRNSEVDAHVLLALRSDAIHLLDTMRAYLPQIYDTMLELTQLDADGVRQAVEGPINVYNERDGKGEPPVRLGEGLVEYLTDERNWKSDSDVNKLQPARRVELPFLQLALTRLWEEELTSLSEQDGNRKVLELRVETLDSVLGGIDGVAAEHVRRKLDALTRGQKRAASQILHYLVTPSGGKIAYSQQDLEKYSETASLTPVLEELARGRILRAVAQAAPEHSGATRYELYHDKLAKPVLKWRTEYLEYGPFACLRDLFTGMDYELPGFGRLFGRLPRTDDDPDHPMSRKVLSRNHLVVLSNLELLDLRSLNGTTINAEPIRLGEPLRLRSGDIVVLANYMPFIFFAVEDEDQVEGIQTRGVDGAWAAVVDGSTRTIIYITAPEIGLRFDSGTGVNDVAPDDPDAFATLSLHHREFINFRPPNLRSGVKMVTIKDAYNFPALPIEIEYPPDIPDTDQFRGARPRRLFMIEDQWFFEIVLNPYYFC